MAEAKEKPEKQKSFADQFDDEDVIFVFRKHPVVMRKGLIFAMIAILLGTVPALIKPEMSFFFGGLAVGFILGMLIFFPFWIAWFYSIFIVTDQRLIQITQKGLFHRSVVDLGLSQIQMVNYQIAGLQETLLGFGTIMMQTYVGDLIIHDVHHPAKIQKKILNILREQGITAANYPANKEQSEDDSEED
ncbi:MAG TPA: PH domain-containing protein [Candidatus Saccharimonadales bacterium]|nr:PH domain-containing protein [Candidatus Saccharimonadales bacterium]